MKIIKRFVACTMVAAGTAMMYKEGFFDAGSKALKKARKIAKKIGVM